MTHRRQFIKHGLVSVAGLSLALRKTSAFGFDTAEARAEYICPPCAPCPLDNRIFTSPGRCPGCGMNLIPRPTTLALADLTRAGAGAFSVPGGIGHENKSIIVNFYRPKRFTSRSPILIVIPGAGRNGDEYRDAWRETADDKGIFVASLTYPERDYDFAAYQMGGVIKNLQIRNIPPTSDGKPPTVVRLRDEDISFDVNDHPSEWLFRDFDRIFDVLAKATGSTQTRYDLFGHSAGGQILHRHVLFHAASRAERVVAANAGFYTLPNLDTPQVLGLKGTGVTREMLGSALGAKLTLLLGEQDDSGEEGGIQLHTPSIDRQGIGRLSRGRYFHRAGEEQARAMGVRFGWQLQVVPKVGHDFRKMTAAAARLLYP